MATLEIVNRNPGGSTYFTPDTMGDWTNSPIVEMEEGEWNGFAWEYDYLTIQMSPVAGFPQLFFRVYGNFNFVFQATSGGSGWYVDNGSVIQKIEVIDQTGLVYNRLSFVSFVISSDKTTVGIDPINLLANSFRPGETPDVADLMAGSDEVIGNSGAEELFGYAGNDVMTGLAGMDALHGGSGNDILDGGADADDLYGEAGNDTILGHTAGDHIDGGAGFDTWALTGSYSTGAGLPGSFDLTGVNFWNIEAIRVTWGAIILNSAQLGGGSTVQTIIAGSGDRDVLQVNMAAGAHVMTLSGLNFVNWNNISGNLDWITLNGTAQADTIIGSRMDDVINALGGANLVRAGAGSDKVNGGAQGDMLRGGDGGDTLVGWGGNDTLIGDDDYGQSPASQPGDDSILGGEGDDILSGLLGTNTIDGGLGSDTVDYGFLMQNPADAEQYQISGAIFMGNGAPGQAFYSVDGPGTLFNLPYDSLIDIEHVNASDYAELILANDLDNRLFAFAGNDSVDGGLGRDTVNGGLGNDQIFGAGGNDLVNGAGGKDRLFGNSGNDTLNGGTGDDKLVGGTGADRFVFDSALSRNVDLITDYVVADDRIDLARKVFGGLALGTLSNAAFKNLSLGSIDASDRILWDPVTGDLFFDADGSGNAASAIRFAVVDSATALTAGEFFVI